MSLVASLALAASSLTLPACSWDKPGVNPYMGDLVAAVDRYRDMPAATRERLKARMQERQYDEIVDIRRDSIVGRYDYGSEIRDMHFGTGQVCRTVSRSRWTDQHLERGLVYCEDGHCLLVPTVCRNVSRIQRGALKPTGGSSTAVPGDEPATELAFEPPGAGDVGTPGPGASGDPGSFLRTAGIPAARESLIGSPNLGGGSGLPPGGGMGLIMLPGGPQGGGGGGGGVTPVRPAVPEPATYLLFGVGVLALVMSGRRLR